MMGFWGFGEQRCKLTKYIDILRIASQGTLIGSNSWWLSCKNFASLAKHLQLQQRQNLWRNDPAGACLRFVMTAADNQLEAGYVQG